MNEGRNNGSTANLKRFSIILGITLYKTIEGISRQGLLLTSIKKGLKLLSIMKSRPKISNPNLIFFLFNFK